MGEITKKIFGDVELDPTYQRLTIEDNENGKVHIHIKNLRLDLTRDAYNQLLQAVGKAYELVSKKCSSIE